MIFDAHGVPVWWQQAAAADAKLLSDGTLAWYTATAGGTSTPGFEIHRLDGSLVRTWRTVGSITDIHDFQILPNGDALMLTYPPRPGTIDLSAYGGPSQNATVVDAEIQEIAPDGTLVWSWNTQGPHPALGDRPALVVRSSRWSTLPDGRKAYDYAHINSIEQTGNTIVASFRHFDAVYAINRSTGDIIWKLGGTARPESLTRPRRPPERSIPWVGSILPGCSRTEPSPCTTTTPSSLLCRARSATGSTCSPRPPSCSNRSATPTFPRPSAAAPPSASATARG